MNKEIDTLAKIVQAEGNITVYGITEALGPCKIYPNENEHYDIYTELTSFYKDAIH